MRDVSRVRDRIRDSINTDDLNIGFFFVLPVLVLMAILLTFPTLQAIWFSLHDLSGTETTWAGLQFYEEIISSDWFLTVFRNTIVWIVGGVALQLLLGFSLALLLNTRFPRRKLVRSLFLIPWVTPVVVVAVIFSWMFSPQFGIVNHFIAWVGLTEGTQSFLGNPDTAMLVVIIMALWKRFPFVMILTLAGLQDIDEQLTKAALIDGAPYFTRLRHVVFPQLLPVLKVVVFLSVLWMFNNFALIFVATGGGPLNATSTFAIEVYELAFLDLDTSEANALAVIMLVLILLFMIAYMRILKVSGEEL